MSSNQQQDENSDQGDTCIYFGLNWYVSRTAFICYINTLADNPKMMFDPAYPPPPGPVPPPAAGYGAPAPGYGAPAPGYGAPAPGYGAPPPAYGHPQVAPAPMTAPTGNLRSTPITENVTLS